MSIFQSLVEKNNVFRQKNEQSFTLFIDNSITLIKSINLPKKENSATLLKMTSDINRLKNTAPGDQALEDIFENNTDYQKQMKWVSLDFAADTRVKRLNDLADEQQKRLDVSQEYQTKNTTPKKDT